ncbi:MAG: hypothetical protein HXX08_22725 [Chloroflexi bacterium]|uniref:Uncharacterized protein n=1 Tax=Candidatus Chlorohelix allophototropha TaxID=3003348 RepID=A0A8T7M983_9CHLR|nr:hypothetical protein [Chloroflexota bacterium]WJW68616.1 hypothetical protein OZ401_004230 [Chloroflexota bacterium L227-S17]
MVVSEREILNAALKKARRILAVLEERAAGYTSLDIPASLKLELEDQRIEVARLERELAEVGRNTGTISIKLMKRTAKNQNRLVLAILPAGVALVCVAFVVLVFNWNKHTVNAGTTPSSGTSPLETLFAARTATTKATATVTVEPTATSVPTQSPATTTANPIVTTTAAPIPPTTKAAIVPTATATPAPTVTPVPTPTAVPDSTATPVPVSLEERLKQANIVLTNSSDPNQIEQVRGYLQEEDWIIVSNNYLNLIGNRKFKKPLDLETFYWEYRVLLNGTGAIPSISQLNDQAKLKQSLVQRWNENYTKEPVTSLEQILVAR